VPLSLIRMINFCPWIGLPAGAPNVAVPASAVTTYMSSVVALGVGVEDDVVAVTRTADAGYSVCVQPDSCVGSVPVSSHRVDRSERRHQLLDVAAEKVVEHGVSAMSMERVAEWAGVSKALPYSHFDNIEDLLVALYQREAVSIGRAEAQRFIDDYFAAHPRVRAYIDRVVAEGRAQGYVTTLLGRRRYLPELGARNPVARNAAERMAANAPIQGTASDIIKLAMVQLGPALAAAGLRSRMVLQVHDELLLEVPEAEVQAVQALLPEVMESVVTLAVPLRVDVKEGRDWAEV